MDVARVCRDHHVLVSTPHVVRNACMCPGNSEGPFIVGTSGAVDGRSGKASDLRGHVGPGTHVELDDFELEAREGGGHVVAKPVSRTRGLSQQLRASIKPHW